MKASLIAELVVMVEATVQAMRVDDGQHDLAANICTVQRRIGVNDERIGAA